MPILDKGSAALPASFLETSATKPHTSRPRLTPHDQETLAASDRSRALPDGRLFEIDA